MASSWQFYEKDMIIICIVKKKIVSEGSSLFVQGHKAASKC